MTARDDAELLLDGSRPTERTTDIDALNAVRGQGYAILALADSVEAAAANMVAAVVDGERPVEANPTHTLVIDDSGLQPIVWSGRWREAPFLEYVPAAYLHGIDAGHLRIVVVTL